jgi:hypothetical protein
MSHRVNRQKKRVRRRTTHNPISDFLAGRLPPLSPARQASIERMVRKIMHSPKVRAETRKMSRELVREVFGRSKRTKRRTPRTERAAVDARR